MAAGRRDRDHALPPRPLGRPRPVGLGQHVPRAERESCRTPGAVGVRGRPRISSSSAAARLPGHVRAELRHDRVPSRGRRSRPAGFEVTAVRLPHYTLETYGFRVERDGVTLAYSGDSAPSGRLVELARDADLFVCEATLLARRARRPAARPPLARRGAGRVRRARARSRLLLTHRPAELPTADGLEPAYDGLELDCPGRRASAVRASARRSRAMWTDAEADAESRAARPARAARCRDASGRRSTVERAAARSRCRRPATSRSAAVLPTVPGRGTPAESSQRLPASRDGDHRDQEDHRRAASAALRPARRPPARPRPSYE